MNQLIVNVYQMKFIPQIHMSLPLLSTGRTSLSNSPSFPDGRTFTNYSGKVVTFQESFFAYKHKLSKTSCLLRQAATGNCPDIMVPHCCWLGVVAGVVFHSGCQGSAGFPHVQICVGIVGM